MPHLEEWLKQHFSGSVFNISRITLPMMNGPPHHIHLLPDAQPTAFHTPTSVARLWEAEVKRQLDEDIKRGIIILVPAGKPVDWRARW